MDGRYRSTLGRLQRRGFSFTGAGKVGSSFAICRARSALMFKEVAEVAQ